MKNQLKWVIIFLIIASIAAGFGWQWWEKQQSALPEGIAFGNGRIEANEVDISVKYAGRVLDILADEGDMVAIEQALVVMDTVELQARLDRAKADLEQGLEAVKEAEVQLTKTRNDLAYAKQQYDRAASLLKGKLVAQSHVDERRNAHDTAKTAVSAAEARLRTLDKGIEAYRASVRQIEAEIAEARLTAPVVGRVLYRLAQKGEVLGAGGKVMTLLDLSNVYMEIFLPAADAGVLQIGAEARIVLDLAPDLPIPARVTFVSPQAQFTPKQVETRSERDKLMFRVKLQIPTELVLKNIDRVKTGLRGVGYVRADTSIPWPAYLDGRLTGAAQ
jgi:HlyD family secretion protein